MSIDPDWFADFHGSVYGSESSLDMCAIDLPTGSRDIIIANHVLEHVADHAQALREMLRVTSPGGVVQLTVPSPHLRFETVDWGFADPNQNLHYRDYGADFAMLMVQRVPSAKAMGVVATDPVTGVADIVYFFASSDAPLARFAQAWRGSHIAVVRVA